MNGRGDSRKSRALGNPTARGFVTGQVFWVGPGELVLLDVLRTGRVSAGAVALALVLVLAALTSAVPVRLGVRAAGDLVARLLFLPTHSWSAAMMLLDAVVIAAAWRAAGKVRR
ncbi:hypothetical protein ACWEVP_36035 [Amycolatopsis sp. NPDC003865]